MRWVVILSVLLCAYVSVKAQHPYFYNIASEEGLPGNEVYDIVQDKQGYIWLGTGQGLYKYDGRNFKNYRNVRQNGIGISNLFVNDQNIIYCQNFFGQIFYVEDDSLHLLLNKSHAQSNFPIYTVSANNNLHFTCDTGVFKIDNAKNQTFTKLNTNSKEEIKCHFKDLTILGNTLYFIERNSIGYFNKEQAIIYKKFNNPEWFVKAEPKQFLKFNNRLFVLMSFLESYSLWEIQSDSILWRKNIPENLGRVFSVQHDGKNNIWVCGNNGALCLNENLETQFNNAIFFPERNINNVMCDKEGNYWFTTLSEGLFVIPNLNVWVLNKENASLPDSKVKKITTDNKGNIYIGQQNGSLSMWNTYSNDIKNIPFKESKKEIQTLFYDSLHNSTIACMNETYLINNKTHKPTIVATHNNIKTIVQLYEDTFLLGSVYKAYIARVKNNTIQPVKTLRNKRVRCAYYQKEQKKLWIGYSDGLYVYQNNIETKVLNKGKSIYAIDIVAGNHNELYISTVNNGILHVTSKAIIQKLQLNADTENITAKKIYFNNNTLWIATAKNIIRFNIAANSAEYMNQLDGLPTTEVFDICMFNQKVFIATPKGLVYFPEDISLTNTAVPSIFISKISIKDKDTTLVSGYSLPYEKNNIAIHFSSPVFRSRGNHYFIYRMSGLDTAWQLVNSSVSMAHFQSLPAGKFLFEVKAVNEDGIASSNVASIQFKIAAPYWQRWWFYLLIMLAFGGFVSIIYAFRIRYINKRNLLEKRFIHSQLSTLKAQMNPHFMFNALSSIQDLILLQKTEKAQYYLGKFSTLTRKILELSGKEFITLQEEITLLSDYLQLESLRFDGALQYEIIYHEIDAEETQIPSMVFQPFVENAIKHGLLHKKGEKKLLIQFTKYENYIECLVEDNGIGRNASEKINMRQKSHTSFATKATAERLALLQEYYGLKIDLIIEDKYLTASETGTRVILKIYNS